MKYIFAFVLFMTAFAGCGCNSSESLGPVAELSQDAGQDAKAEATTDALAEAQDALTELGQEAQAEVGQDALSETGQDVAAEAEQDALAEAQAEAQAEAGVQYPECQAFPNDQVLREYVAAPVGPTKFLSVVSYVDFPGTAESDPTTPTRCWVDTAGKGALNCELKNVQSYPAHAYPGTKVTAVVGTSDAYGADQNAWYCTQTSCPYITLVLCDGADGIGRVDNGVLSGNVVYVDNGTGWMNPVFTTPF